MNELVCATILRYKSNNQRAYQTNEQKQFYLCKYVSRTQYTLQKKNITDITGAQVHKKRQIL